MTKSTHTRLSFKQKLDLKDWLDKCANQGLHKGIGFQRVADLASEKIGVHVSKSAVEEVSNLSSTYEYFRSVEARNVAQSVSAVKKQIDLLANASLALVDAVAQIEADLGSLASERVRNLADAATSYRLDILQIVSKP